MDRTNGPGDRLESALRAVMEALPNAQPRERALLLKRAGDICVGLDERRKALPWYGKAIDQLLELGEGGEAARLCRLIIYVQPDAVRARGTLTWIEIGSGQEGEAIHELRAYAQAARAANQTGLAAQQMEWMFDVARLPALRQALVAEMRTMDAACAGALEGRLRALPEAIGRDALWSRVLDATVGGRSR